MTENIRPQFPLPNRNILLIALVAVVCAGAVIMVIAAAQDDETAPSVNSNTTGQGPLIANTASPTTEDLDGLLRSIEDAETAANVAQSEYDNIDDRQDDALDL